MAAALSRGAPPPPGFGAGGQPPPSGGGNGPLIAGLVIAVLAIVGVAVFFLTRDDGPSTGPADTSVVVTVTTTATTGTSATTATTVDTVAPTTPASSADTTEAPETTDEPDPTVSDDIPPPQDEPDGLGDDPALDELAQDCHAGEMQACDDLFFQSPSDSEYEVYGDTCAGRQPENGGLCTVAFPG